VAVVTVAAPKNPAFVEGIPKTPREVVPEEVEVTGAAWSPDGRQIAYCTGTVQFLARALSLGDEFGRLFRPLTGVWGAIDA
jgi:hypothetical protein